MCWEQARALPTRTLSHSQIPGWPASPGLCVCGMGSRDGRGGAEAFENGDAGYAAGSADCVCVLPRRPCPNLRGASLIVCRPWASGVRGPWTASRRAGSSGGTELAEGA